MEDPSNIIPPTNAAKPPAAKALSRSRPKGGGCVETRIKQCVKGVLPLLAEPDVGARRISEIRYGEILDVFEERKDGFAWVQNRYDRYVGYIYAVNALSDELTQFSSRVNVLCTHIHAEPDVRAEVTDKITLGSYVNIVGEEDGFSKLSGGGYVFSKHVTASKRSLEADHVYTAGRLLGAPYLWGGRTPFGLDASGLVQLSLDVADIECMRDVDEQREAFGQPLPTHWRDFLWRRGDLVFFSDHVGIMTDNEHIIHADAHMTKVVVEPLVELVLRGREIVAMGRVPAP